MLENKSGKSVNKWNSQLGVPGTVWTSVDKYGWLSMVLYRPVLRRREEVPIGLVVDLDVLQGLYLGCFLVGDFQMCSNFLGNLNPS